MNISCPDRYEQLLRLERRIGRLNRRADRIAIRERERRRIMKLVPIVGDVAERLMQTAQRRNRRQDELYSLSAALHHCWMAIHDRRPL